MHAALRHRGIRVGCKRVERLMRSLGLSGLVPRKRGKTTIRVPGVARRLRPGRAPLQPDGVEPALGRGRQVRASWLGWLYLAAVMDCYSRRMVGWSMRGDLQVELVIDALEMAVARRRPQPALVHHSDQGSQYVSLLFGERCREAGVQLSMARRGRLRQTPSPRASSPSLEKELLRRHSFRTRQEARTAVFDYIETFYNPIRLHSTRGYFSPAEYERLKLQERREAA